MKQNSIILILSILLSAATGIIVYLIFTNPVKGYHMVYERNNLRLFAKDTGDQKKGDVAEFEGGEHVEYKKGKAMIQQFRANRIQTREDTLKVTRFINFDFHNVFAYMGYLLTAESQDIPKEDLGFRVYFGEEATQRNTDMGPHYPVTMLFAPTKKGNLVYKQGADKDFDFFNQGSICPENCPDDDGELLN